MNLLLAKKTHPADNRIVNSVTNLYFWYTSLEKATVFVGKSQRICIFALECKRKNNYDHVGY